MMTDVEKAYLFDLEGTLCDTAPFYAKCLIECFIRVNRKYRLDLTPPNYEELFAISRDAPLDDAAASLMRHYPALAEHGAELEERFTSAIPDVLTRASGLSISTAIQVFHRLADVGAKLGIVTDCPQELALVVIEASGLRVPEGCPVVHAGLCDEPKPSPEPYRVAAEMLNVSIRNCVAFEDSPRGVRSAKAAGAYVVQVPTPHMVYDRTDEVNADEEVVTLREARPIAELSRLLNDSPVTPRRISFYNEFFEFSSLAVESQDRLIEETYAVYKNNFDGRDFASWREKFFKEELDEVLIATTRDSDGYVRGFFFVDLYRLDRLGEESVVAKLNMGVDAEFRGAGLMGFAYARAYELLCKKYPQKVLEIFENIANPVVYSHLVRLFSDHVRPHPDVETSECELARVECLKDYFGYSTPVACQPFVVESTSVVQMSWYSFRKLKRSRDRYIRFFNAWTSLVPGRGIACLIRLPLDGSRLIALANVNRRLAELNSSRKKQVMAERSEV